MLHTAGSTRRMQIGTAGSDEGRGWALAAGGVVTGAGGARGGRRSIQRVRVRPALPLTRSPPRARALLLGRPASLCLA